MEKKPVKVLVIRKVDKTIHLAPLANKARLLALNNKTPEAQKFKLEEMDEEDAKQLPFIDDTYVTAEEAKGKLADLQKDAEDKDARIKELEALLEKTKAGADATKTADGSEKTNYSSMNVDALKAALTEREIVFDAKALKADLVALLEGADATKTAE